MTKQFKTFRFAEMLVKTDGDAGTIQGYGSTFGGSPDAYGDIIAPGAFKASLRTRKPKMLYQHDSSAIAGVWDSADEDNHGLFLKGRFINTPLSQQAREECSAGALDSMSIGFSTNDQDIDPKTGIRTLTDLSLYEVSLVTFPANENATISAVKACPATIREFEARLRDEFGLTHRQAKDVAAGGFKALSPARDEQEENAADDLLTAAYQDFFKSFNSHP